MDKIHTLHNTIVNISNIWLHVKKLTYTYKLNSWNLKWDELNSEIRLHCLFVELPSNNHRYFLCKKYLDIPLWLLDELSEDTENTKRIEKYFKDIK